MLFERWRYVAAGLAAVLASLALAAWLKDGWLLLHWDEPVQRAVEDARSSGMTAIVKRISFLGSTVAVLTLGATLAALVLAPLPRCRHGDPHRHAQPTIDRVHVEGGRRP